MIQKITSSKSKKRGTSLSIAHKDLDSEQPIFVETVLPSNCYVGVRQGKKYFEARNETGFKLKEGDMVLIEQRAKIGFPVVYDFIEQSRPSMRIAHSA